MYAVDIVRAGGFVLAALLVFAAALTVASVVRLALFARREEIHIMQLVGAPIAYIRGPFIVEGLIQGGLGAIAALIVLWITFLDAEEPRRRMVGRRHRSGLTGIPFASDRGRAARRGRGGRRARRIHRGAQRTGDRGIGRRLLLGSSGGA